MDSLQIIKLTTAEPPPPSDRWFWLAIREGLMVIVQAIERRYLPDLKKGIVK